MNFLTEKQSKMNKPNPSRNLSSDASFTTRFLINQLYKASSRKPIMENKMTCLQKQPQNVCGKNIQCFVFPKGQTIAKYGNSEEYIVPSLKVLF